MAALFINFFRKVRESIAAAVYNKLYYSERKEQLTYLALNSHEKGIAELNSENVIVSLTTHGRRIYEVYLAIESIMQGSVKPNRIILWLASDRQDKELPQTLINQTNRGLEIKYTEEIGPYTKLIPTLKEYPESLIITIDDDILYPYDTIELLISAHRNNPNCICANRILDIQLDKQGNPTSIPTWSELLDKDHKSKLNFFEGVGGVLYPPQSFTSEVFNQSVFKSICPTADDVWFNCMAMLAKTPIVSANYHYPHFPLLINETIQDSALCRINNESKPTLNDKQLAAVMKKYNLSYGE